MTETRSPYRRILLKLSGEALAGDKGSGFDFVRVNQFADEIKGVVETGVGVGLVIGGGNMVRGTQLAALGMDRVAADYMGMLGTVINGVLLRAALGSAEVEVRLMTAVPIPSVAEPYIRLRAIRHLEKGRVVIFGAGTGNPFFTTDSAACLRGIEV